MQCYFTCFLPVVKQLSFYRTETRDFNLYRINHLGLGEILDTVSVVDTNSTYTSPKELIYYAPRYPDYHKSNLFIFAFNLEKIFPCIAGKNILPTCGRFTAEEDGLNKGQNIVEAGDRGNDMSMFGKWKRVYGFSVSGCQEATKACYPTYYEVSITCLLPREYCAE